MNGVHDLGGMDGFGPVEVEEHEPVFHQPWESRVFGMVVAMSAQRFTNTHSFRHAIERMQPTHYLSSPYYEHWLTALMTLLIETGVTTRADLEAKAAGRLPLSQPVRLGGPTVQTPSATTPLFFVGSTVTVRNLNPLGHTRCPRYVRGKRGVVARIDSRFPLPDIRAHAATSCEQYEYSVRFAARELWGESADPAASVHVDLWESYLEGP